MKRLCQVGLVGILGLALGWSLIATRESRVLTEVFDAYDISRPRAEGLPGFDRAWNEMPPAKRAATQRLLAKPAAPNPNFPSGSYMGSCKSCVMSNDRRRLRCSCQDGYGGWSDALMEDASQCFGHVENEHGHLICASGSHRAHTGGFNGVHAGTLQSPHSEEPSHYNQHGRHVHVMGADGTFAQNYQDTWVMRLAASNGWIKQSGFFMDLGAFNGEFCSNSRLLEDLLGWNGICVEPFPNNPNSPSNN